MWASLSLRAKAIPGFYIAAHPWSSSHRTLKIGYSGNLSKRLHHTTYITAFPEGWRFCATIECKARDAHALEQAVMSVFQPYREGDRELLSGVTPEVVQEVATTLAKQMGFPHEVKIAPQYPRRTRRKKPEHLKRKAKKSLAAKRVGRLQAVIARLQRKAKRQLQTTLSGSGAMPMPNLVHAPVDHSGNSTTHGENLVTHGLLQTSPNKDWQSSSDGAAAKDGEDSTPTADAELALTDSLPSTAELFGEANGGLIGGGGTRRRGRGASSLSTTYHTIQLRDYQVEAVRHLQMELELQRKVILQMACRSGKTPVAHALLTDDMQKFFQKSQSTTQQSSKRRVKSAATTNDAAVVAEGNVYRALFLVPGLALLRQTVLKLAGYGLDPDVELLLVGSDPTPIVLPDGRTLRMTTDPQTLRQAMLKAKKMIVLSTYISSCLVMQQLEDPNKQWSADPWAEIERLRGSVTATAASPVVTASQESNAGSDGTTRRRGRRRRRVLETVLCASSADFPSDVLSTKAFRMVIFDEAHRACGRSDVSLFNAALLSPHEDSNAQRVGTSASNNRNDKAMKKRVHQQRSLRTRLKNQSQSKQAATESLSSSSSSSSFSQKRIFMTATPTYDTPIRMNDTKLFGGVGYRFYLRSGINMGFVNPFHVRVILGPHNVSSMVPMILEAAKSVNKMLVFCKNIPHAEELSMQVRQALQNAGDHAGESPVKRRVGRPPREAGAVSAPPTATKALKSSPHQIFCAHSKMGHAGVTEALHAFSHTPRGILFNVRLFQEGVEIPDLNAVFFAAPRYSPRDIIQSICRPLNRLEGKPPSTVFLPALFNPKKAADHPVNLANFSTLVPYTDALLDEDPTLFEYLIDPQQHQYGVSITGVRSLAVDTHTTQQVLLSSLRRGVRFSTRTARCMTDRLVRSERLPWAQAFGELRRIVTQCHRYPKINDSWIVGDAHISMHRFYRYVREGYKLYVAKEPSSYLQPHQIHDLESLPYWKEYGVRGPYPWAECFQTLKAYVEAHKTFPLLDIHKGGFIGLDATPFERLAGALGNVNQQDTYDQFRVAPHKCADLDKLCKRYGLQWRKPRDPKTGRLLSRTESSCITRAFDSFKTQWDHPEERTPRFLKYVETHFPGYPQKHFRMENLDVQRLGIAPPRKKFRSDARVKKLQRATGVEEVERSVVVCRVCRVEVETREWATHVESEDHKRKLGKVRRYLAKSAS